MCHLCQGKKMLSILSDILRIQNIKYQKELIHSYIENAKLNFIATINERKKYFLLRYNSILTA